MSSENYVEDSTIILPILPTLNNLSKLGDLWDCHSSEVVGDQLFKEDLDGEYISVSPIDSLDYQLIHNKSSSDLIKSFNIGGEMKLEILAGLIPVTGSANYVSEEKQQTSREHLICHYARETYSLYIKQNSRAIINELVEEKIIKGEIKATHCVRGIILGAQLNADIVITQKNLSSKTDFDGDICGKLTYGAINATAKANLKLLDNNDSKDYNLNISVRSIPTMRVETNSINEMFKKIEEIDSLVEKQKHFPKLGDKIIGLPIRFILKPVRQFIDVKIDKLYFKMSETVLKNINEFLVIIQDIQKPGYITERVIKSCRSLIKVIIKDRSPLNQEIYEYEKKLKKIGEKNFQKAVNELKKYKLNQSNVENLLKLKMEFDDECSANKILEKVSKFIDKGESELRAIGEADIENSLKYVEILTNEKSLNNFIEGERVTKIWLHTDQNSLEGVFMRFYDMSQSLNKLGIKVGVALKSISTKFELCVKVGGITVTYDKVEEIPYILSIIGVAVDIGSKNEKLFFSVIAELEEIHLPLKVEQMSDINNLIEIFKRFKNVRIAQTRLGTLSFLRKEDDIYRGFVVIDATLTSQIAIRNLSTLVSLSNLKKVKWIVGNLDIPSMQSAGLIFLIKNGKVIAVCLDDFDVVLFKEKFDKDFESSVSMFSPKNLENSYHPIRAMFSEKTIKLIELEKQENLKIGEFGLESFAEDPDINLMDALKLACNALKNDDTVFSTLAEFAISEYPELKDILLEAGYSSTENRFAFKLMSDVKRKSLEKVMENFLLINNPLATRISLAIKFLDDISYNNETEEKLCEENINRLLLEIKEETECPENIKKGIEAFDQKNFSYRCSRIKELFKNYEIETKNSEIAFKTRMFHSFLVNTNDYNLSEIIGKYIEKIPIKDGLFDQKKKTEPMQRLQNNETLQLVLSLSELSLGSKYFILHKCISKYAFSPDHLASINELLVNLTNDHYFNENNWRDIWKNNRFQYIVKSNIDHISVISRLFQMGCEKHVPSYIPTDVAEKITEFRNDRKELELPALIKDFEHFCDILRNIRRSCIIPTKFRSILANSVKENDALKLKLSELRILNLFGWDEDLFNNLIEMSSIKKAVEILDNYDETDKAPKTIIVGNVDKLLSPTNEEFKLFNELECEKLENFEIQDGFREVFGNSIKILGYEDFIRLTTIVEKPRIYAKDLQGLYLKVMPYLLQKIKMWGCNAMTADNIYGLFAEVDNEVNPVEGNPRRKSRRRKEPEEVTNVNMNKSHSHVSLSRLDILNGFMNSLDSLVAEDILCIMSKFSMALPLIIPDLQKKDSFKILIPWLTKPIIKWESSPEKIIENHLFIDKFKMIVVTRIGSVMESKCGKSTIINQIFSSQNMFSRCGEPGADKGKPVTIEGTVEFIWLTQETASPIFWESVLLNHYKKQDNELILLANVHGDALNFEETIKFLKTIASRFIVFVIHNEKENADDNYSKFLNILELTDENDLVLNLEVDPTEEYNLEEVINTSQIHDDKNIRKLRKVFRKAILTESKMISFENLRDGINLKSVPTFDYQSLNDLIKFIEEKSCEDLKKNMISQGNKTHQQCIEIWLQNRDLQNLITLMRNILSLERNSRLKAITHLEKELGRISEKESSIARAQYLTAVKGLQKAYGAKVEANLKLNHLKEQVNEAVDRINKSSLGLENFYREIGKLYEIYLANRPAQNPFINLPESYAELLIDGQVIELLDGDANSISGPWLSAICDSVYRMRPKLKVFVISILGLQSSGKSTLLNALFSCNFAVSVGRCTRGLFMRLLFLDSELVKKVQFHALLVIDTEGLATPEKYNDQSTEKKDRLMATFAIGISHLTLVNILGESMSNLTDILQIALVAMARLERSEIMPDLLMVQHLKERNVGKISKSSNIIGEALDKAIQLADREIVNLGVRNSEALEKIRTTIFSGKLFRLFRPFSNGASAYAPPSEEYHQDVVELYKSILDVSANSQSKSDFKQWEVLMQSYWNLVKKEEFMRFKDVKDLQEFIERNNCISKVKEAIEYSFREHSDSFKDLIPELAKRIIRNEINEDSVKAEIISKMKFVPTNCSFEIACEKCKKFAILDSDLNELVRENSLIKQETQSTIISYIVKTREWYIRHLSQMLSAIKLKQVNTADVLERIEIRLKEVLRNRGENREIDIQATMNKIWYDIKLDAADKVVKTSIDNQINEEISDVYKESGAFVRSWRTHVVKTLRNLPAIKRNWLKNKLPFVKTDSNILDDNHAYLLEGILLGICDNMLTEENAETYQTGMVAKLRNKITFIVGKFQKDLHIKFLSEFEWNIQYFTILKFWLKMRNAQHSWDQEHNPLCILNKNADQYLSVIRKRLEYGFTCDSDGIIAGNCLLNAIKQKALKSANRQRIDDILGINWLTNSEKVRLKYFSKLVESIQKELFEEVLVHFENPKDQIELWFENYVNNFSNGEEFIKYRETFDAEIERVIQEVTNRKTMKKIYKFIEKYVSLCDGIEFSLSLNMNETTDNQINIFKDRLIGVLDKNKEQFRELLKEELMQPSKDKLVINRLGCTFACPLCRALCWGQRNHEQDNGELKKHHSCHQPMGLTGVTLNILNELITISCHEEKTEYWVLGEKTIKWQDLITMKGYDDWKYDAHINDKFNDLMKWFFLKLNSEIAKKFDLKQASQKQLSESKMIPLNIEEIMAEINGRL